MFGDGSLSFHEFATREPHPLARIHDAVLDFLRGRKDAVLYGAQAVNAFVDESRMTQIDLRPIDVLPPCQRVKKVMVATPPELIASKVVSLMNRSTKPKGFMDEADLRRLLLTFPELKTEAAQLRIACSRWSAAGSMAGMEETDPSDDRG